LRILGRELAPFLSALRANHRIGLRLAEKEQLVELDEEMREYLALDLSEIQSAYELHRARRESLLSKARVNVVGITLALTFIFGAMGAIAPEHSQSTHASRRRRRSQKTALFYIEHGLVASSCLYLLIGGLCALRALRVERSHDLWLHTRLHRFANSENEQDDGKKSRLILVIKLSEDQALIHANLLDTSYVCLRNGIMAISGFLLLAVGASALG
jgi:hypothetical protein